jgi:tetratricopeptide (TPR) repeat protein
MTGAFAVLFSLLIYIGSDPSAHTHFQRGAELAARGDLNAAEQEYLAGLKITPDPAAYNNLGVLYFQQQDFTHAASSFRNACKLQPNDPEIAFNLGLALYKSDNTAEAIPQLISATRSKHASEAHYLLGASYFEQKKWDKAIAEIEQSRAGNPDQPEALFILTRAYKYAGNPAASLAAATRLLKSYPDSPFTHELLAEGYDKDGQPDKSIDEFQQAIAALPQSPELHFMLGYVCWRWKRYDQAIGPLEEEIRINPNYSAAYYYLGDIAFRQNEYARALRCFEQALHSNSGYTEAEFGIGKVYLKTGRVKDAVAAMEKARQKSEDIPELHYWLGRALIQAGRETEGRKELAQVAELNRTQNQKRQQLFNGVPVGERQQHAESQGLP